LWLPGFRRFTPHAGTSRALLYPSFRTSVAFAGKAAEYDFAYEWLERELCPAAGCMIENVFVIPGNHDVDRNAEAGPANQAE
jgi:hypothetical protein